MTLIAFALACVGMLALCLSLPRHHRDLFNTSPSNGRRRLLRLAGALALVGCIASNLADHPTGIAWVVACGHVMLAGLIVGLGLAWRSTWRNRPAR